MKVIKYVNSFLTPKTSFVSPEFDLVLNPDLAFKGTEEQLQAHIGKLTRTTGFEFVDFAEAQKDWDEWVKSAKVGTLQSRLKDEALNIYYDPKIHTPENVLEHKLKMAESEFRVEYSVYSTWPSFLVSMFECLFSTGMNYVQLKITKNVKFEVFEKELNLALKYLKPDEDGFKTVDVIDHTLSEFGPSPKIKYKNSRFYICERYSEEKKITPRFV